MILSIQPERLCVEEWEKWQKNGGSDVVAICGVLAKFFKYFAFTLFTNLHRENL